MVSGCSWVLGCNWGSSQEEIVKRTPKEEAEKLQKLLSIMKSQGWLPQEESVRQLLCSNSSCLICNAMALEIQQLLGEEKKKISPVSLKPSRSFLCLEALPLSKVEFDRSPELCSKHARDISLASSLTPSQSTDQKSSTQSTAPSTGDSNVQYYCPDPWQKQEPQRSNVSQDAGSLSSSSVEESRVPANQQKKRKKTKKFVLKDQEAGLFPAALFGFASTLAGAGLADSLAERRLGSAFAAPSALTFLLGIVAALDGRRVRCLTCHEAALRMHWGKAGRLINPAYSAQNQDYELAHPNIHFIYELLEHVNGMNLQIQNCRISTTQDNKRTAKRGPSESLLSVV
ncbi:hypothetical protein STEG23_024973 [Scotinomys teguina]